MIPGTYNFTSHRKGDSLTTTLMTITQTINGETRAMNLSRVTIVAQFRSNATSPVVLTLSTANGKINITNATQGAIRINPVILDMDAGFYIYDMEFTFPSGEKRTYLTGSLFVEQDITR